MNINPRFFNNPFIHKDESYSDFKKLIDDVINRELHEIPVFLLTSFMLQYYFPIRAHFIYTQIGDTFIVKSNNTFLFKKTLLIFFLERYDDEYELHVMVKCDNQEGYNYKQILDDAHEVIFQEDQPQIPKFLVIIKGYNNVTIFNI
jgi:hypothetical protein